MIGLTRPPATARRAPPDRGTRASSGAAAGCTTSRCVNSALLIVDEVGFRPLDRAEANLLFRLISARYERGSIILTSNRHVRDWPEVFAGDEILTTAILDRLLHHVHVVHIDARSYRLRELDALLRPTPSPATAPPPTPSTDGPPSIAKPPKKGA